MERNESLATNVSSSVDPRWKSLLKYATGAASLYALASVAGGIVLTEMQLHPTRVPLRNTAGYADQIRQKYHAELQEVSITAADGAVLRGWYVQPPNDNGNAVVLLHGVADNREGVFGYAPMFLNRGYRVLMPDARAHGTSGGAIATYGVTEADDIHRWVDWLKSRNAKCVFALGESMGAAQLLQSLSRETRFCAVVAEASFARFDEVAPERAAHYMGLPFWFGRTVERPGVWIAIAYTRWKYNLDFTKANPADAVAASNVPVLLIAGTADREILPHHSEEMSVADSRVRLWLVQGAEHTGAYGTDPEQFERRVTEFFASHQK